MTRILSPFYYEIHSPHLKTKLPYYRNGLGLSALKALPRLAWVLDAAV